MKTSITSIIFLFLTALSTPAQAARNVPPAAKQVPCALLEDFAGEVRILDANRSQVHKTEKKGGVPCGSWISVQRGWANLTHRQGFHIKSGPDTFFQIFDNQDGKTLTGQDHLVLYKGKVYSIAPYGSGEMRLQTANAKARLSGSIAVLVYERSEATTQLIGLEGSATLENRFQNARRIAVAAGEATDLNVKKLRVLPSTPRAVKQASLKLVLHDIEIEEREWHQALQVADLRSKRKFASIWADKKNSQDEEPKRPPIGDDGRDEKRQRGLASLPQKLPDQTVAEMRIEKRKGHFNEDFNYDRFPASPSDPKIDAYLKQKWVGGVQGNPKQFLEPNRYAQEQKAKAAMVIDDPGVKFDEQKQRAYEKEKQRLIKQLQAISLSNN